MIQNQKFHSIVCSSAINKSTARAVSLSGRSFSAFLLALLTVCVGLFAPLSGLLFISDPAYAQNGIDGSQVGPDLYGLMKKRQDQRDKTMQDMNKNAASMGLQRQPNLSDLFPQVPLGLTIPQPINLEGVKIPGLNSKSVEILANNQFMVVHGNSFNFPTMADLYRDNRLSGRSNFVTADVITHIYFVIMNTLYVKVIEDTLFGELESLLKSLVQSCVNDYRNCDVAEVKDDIQRNLAFVIVALRLLDPKAELADMGGASDLARTEIEAMKHGLRGHSVIFNRDQDFSLMRPFGFYATTVKTSNFYRAASWLSIMYFPLSDVTNNSETGGGNTFRRSILLYRALELGKTKSNETLLSQWQHIVEIYSLITMGRITREPSVYPKDLRSMFNTAGKLEFKDLLYTLAQPLSRARLLLSIKNQRQMGLNATSIFEIERPKESDTATLVFRFLPPITPYEFDWLRSTVKDFKDGGTAGDQYVNPLSLYILYSWGASPATNILHPMVDHLDPSLFYGLGELLRNEGRRQRQNDLSKAFEYPERRWTVLSDYFVSVKKGSQAILYSDYWMTQRMSGASGALVDSFIAIDKSYKTALAPSKQVTGTIGPGGPATTSTLTAADAQAQAQAAAQAAMKGEAGSPAKAKNGAAALASTADAAGAIATHGTTAAPGKTEALVSPPAPPKAAAKVPIFHYLEPSPDYYRKLSTFMVDNENELIRLNAFPQSFKSKIVDFNRLIDRLVKICDKEVAFEPLPPVDFNLLASFDQVLSAVDSPLAGSIYIPGISGGGASIGLGDAGVCYIVFNTDKGPYLSRGGVYTYYEVAGGPFKNEHWERKKSFGFLRPLSWLSQFDIVQESQAPIRSKNSPEAPSAGIFKVPGPPIDLKVK